MSYTRAAIEAIESSKRPLIRCCITHHYTTEDGQRDSYLSHVYGKIVVDGNNPWLVIRENGQELAERFSWGLLLDVLNNPRATPIHFTKEFS